MAGSRALQGVCNDLLETFISRNNRIDGYWALGFFQAVLLGSPREMIWLDLVGFQEPEIGLRFRDTISFYRCALVRIATSKRIPIERIKSCCIDLRSLSPELIDCVVRLTSDRGVAFASRKSVHVRVHDASKEYRSGIRGPTTNQVGG